MYCGFVAKKKQFTIVLLIIVVLVTITYNITVTTNVRRTRGLQATAKTYSSIEKSDGRRRNKNISKEIPSSVTDHLRVFVLFIGHTHSSHSIVASVLDSHPHMIVSHESGIVPALINNSSSSTKSYVYNRIWISSQKSVSHGRRVSTGKGYNLLVDKEWQGRYDTYIDVLGDDEAQVIPHYLLHGEKAQFMLKQLPSLVGAPVKLFHIIRNPYDNIATDILYRIFHRNHHQVSNAKNNNESVTVDPQVVDESIHSYFHLYEGVEYVKKNYDTMTIHIVDFIFHPKSVITEICEYLGVVCSEDYIDKCSEKIFNKESKTRYKITWKNKQIASIRSSIRKFDSLKRYKEFDS